MSRRLDMPRWVREQILVSTPEKRWRLTWHGHGWKGVSITDYGRVEIYTHDGSRVAHERCPQPPFTRFDMHIGGIDYSLVVDRLYQPGRAGGGWLERLASDFAFQCYRDERKQNP